MRCVDITGDYPDKPDVDEMIGLNVSDAERFGDRYADGTPILIIQAVRHTVSTGSDMRVVIRVNGRRRIGHVSRICDRSARIRFYTPIDKD